MIYFLTNASKPIYRRDLLNVCNLNTGARLTFDYRSFWVDSPIVDKKEAGLAGMDALLFYYDPRTDADGAPDGSLQLDHSIPGVSAQQKGKQEEFEFYPVRYLKIISAERFDHSWRFCVELGDWYWYNAAPEKAKQHIDECQKRFRSVAERRPRPGRELVSSHSKFVILDEESRFAQKEDRVPKAAKQGERWNRFVSFFSCIRGMRDCCFVWLRASEFDQRDNPISYKLTPMQDLRQIEVPSGIAIWISAFVLYGPDAHPVPPCVVMSPETGWVHGPVGRQHGGGVEYQFQFIIRKCASIHCDLLKLSIPDLKEPDTAGTSVLARAKRAGGEVVGPEFHFLLRVLPADRPIAWALICLVLGSLLAGLDAATISRAFHLSQEADLTYWVWGLTRLVGAVATVVGALRLIGRGIFEIPT
ncbi:MAG: hypothetical protein SF069_11690 [Phycisphaerae bacterium]|nr:hypothetical protein [Phycisphaerae bacterium]